MCLPLLESNRGQSAAGVRRSAGGQVQLRNHSQGISEKGTAGKTGSCAETFGSGGLWHVRDASAP